MLHFTPALRNAAEGQQRLEPKEDQAPAQHLLTKQACPVNGNAMYLVEVVKKQRLVGKREPIRKTEKGRANHHYLRAHREQGAAKEHAPVTQEEIIRKPTKMMLRPEEEFMRKVFCMARRHKGPKVLVGAKEPLVREVVKVAESLEAGVPEDSVKASELASPWVARG